MTVRYEANPPKILPGTDTKQSVARFVDRIRTISEKCDAIHLTENVLGFERVSPLEVGGIIREEIPGLPVTASLRVRDRSEDEICDFVQRGIDIGLAGVLVLMGDPSQTGKADSGQVPSSAVRMLRENGMDSEIDLYLSVPSRPDWAKLRRKTDAGPKGFMTQVVQSAEQVQALSDNLGGFSIIPIILFPSAKNARSAEFLSLDLATYSQEFEGLLRASHDITGDVLITSPNDFAGIDEFLSRTRL